MSDQLNPRRGAPRARNLERSVGWLVLLGGAPAVVAALVYLFKTADTPEVRWTLVVLILGVWWAAAASSTSQPTERSRLRARGAPRRGLS